MRFSVFGVIIDITVPFAVVIAFLLIMDNSGLMSASLFAVVSHEIGHLLTMKYIGCAPRSVKFTASGVLICGTSYCSVKDNVVIALSGPIVNFVFALSFYCFNLIIDSRLVLVYSAVSLLVGLVNMLPIKGLDGGTICFAVLNAVCTEKAAFLFKLVSLLTAFVMITLGIIVFVTNFSNPSLLLLGLYLIILNIIKS